MTPDIPTEPARGLFAPLDALDPDLFAALLRETAKVTPQPVIDKTAALLELRLAAPLLQELHGSGVRRVALAGLGPGLDDLLRSGLLDGFELVAAHSADGGEQLFAYARGHLGVLPLAALAESGAEAVLVTDPALEARTRQLHPRVLALPALAQDRALRLFLPATRRRFPEVFAQREAQAAAILDAAFEPGKTVLFAGIYAYFNFNRMSTALRARGLRTVFLCLNPSNAQFRDNAFDAVVHAGSDMDLFYRLLTRHAYRCVHFQAWLGLHVFAAAAARLATSPFVAEMNDIPQFVLTRAHFDAAFGPGQHEQECACVDTVIDHADALILNALPEAAPELTAHAGRQGKLFSFHSYPSPEHFPPRPAQGCARPYRLGFAGSVNPSSHPDAVFGDVKLLGLIGELIAQDLEFHLFFNPFQKLDPQGVFWDYFHQQALNPRLRLRQGISPAALAGELAQLHYGSMLYRIPAVFHIRAEHFRYMMPTKFFTYLEAGLPVLVSEELRGIAGLVRRHGLGLVVPAADIPRLGQLLDAADHARLQANVLAYREAHSMPRMLDELLAIYDHARAARRQHS